MDVHLIDGTYELFRHFFAVPSSKDEAGNEIGAMRGVIGSVIGMIENGSTHLGVATDHVIESFRNDLYAGYKTGEGIEPDLRSQFVPLEEALRALGVVVWPMVEQEADDALAAAAWKAAADKRVNRVLICTPDKDLGQCVVGDRVLQLDRRKNQIRNADGVREKFGVAPESIPDYLALVGDSADGFPGLRGWGAKSAAIVLGGLMGCEVVPVRGASSLSSTLVEQWELALLFRDLATLRTDALVFDSVDQLRWDGPLPHFEQISDRMKARFLWERAMAANAANS